MLMISSECSVVSSVG